MHSQESLDAVPIKPPCLTRQESDGLVGRYLGGPVRLGTWLPVHGYGVSDARVLRELLEGAPRDKPPESFTRTLRGLPSLPLKLQDRPAGHRRHRVDRVLSGQD